MQATSPERAPAPFVAVAKLVLDKVDNETEVVASLGEDVFPRKLAMLEGLSARAQNAAVVMAFNIACQELEYSEMTRGRMLEYCVLGIHIGRLL